MPTSVIPALLAGLVTASRAALPAVTVYYGFGVSDDPGDYLMVGVDDPNQLNMASSATADQKPGPFGTNRPRDEEGEITCVALSWNGDADQKAATEAVFAIAAGMELSLRTDPTVGAVPHLQWVGYGARLALSQGQDEDGAQAMLVFGISFRARI